MISIEFQTFILITRTIFSHWWSEQFWKQNTIFPPSVSRVFLQWGSLLEERETKGIVYGSGIPCNCIPSQMLLHISNVLTLWVLIKHFGKVMGGGVRVIFAGVFDKWMSTFFKLDSWGKLINLFRLWLNSSFSNIQYTLLFYNIETKKKGPSLILPSSIARNSSAP